MSLYKVSKNRNPIYNVIDDISARYRHKKETPSEEDVYECISLTDYRTIVDSLKDFALFIEWYELYRS